MEWRQDSWILQLGLFFIILVSACVRVCLRPLNRIRLLADQVGFSHVQGSARKKAAQIQRLRQMRQKGRLPPSFPNGWYALAESREVSHIISCIKTLLLSSDSPISFPVGSSLNTPRCRSGGKFCGVPRARKWPGLCHQCLLSGKPKPFLSYFHFENYLA